MIDPCHLSLIPSRLKIKKVVGGSGHHGGWWKGQFILLSAVKHKTFFYSQWLLVFAGFDTLKTLEMI
jgi:hypothetical protein